MAIRERVEGLIIASNELASNILNAPIVVGQILHEESRELREKRRLRAEDAIRQLKDGKTPREIEEGLGLW